MQGKIREPCGLCTLMTSGMISIIAFQTIRGELRRKELFKVCQFSPPPPLCNILLEESGQRWLQGGVV